MNVLFACDVLKYAYGGVRYYIHELVRQLAAYPDVRLTLFAERPEELETLPADLPRRYVDFGRTPFRIFNYLTVSGRHFAEYDLIHFPFSNVYLAMSWAMLRPGGPKFVVTVHDLIPLVMPEYRTPTLGLFYRFWFPRILRRASAVLADSRYTKDDLHRHFRVPDDKVVVSHLGLNAQFRGIVPVREKRPFFLAVSTVEPRKNFERTVRAFLKFKETTPGWAGTLKLVGKMLPGNHALLDLVARNPGHVELLGPIGDADLADLYRHATGLIYPSLYEGFGLPVLEAMAVGCPVVTSETTSIPEVGGDAVVYVDPLSVESIAGGVRAVALDADLRTRLIDGGLARAGQFSWEKCAAGVREVYYRAVGRTPP